MKTLKQHSFIAMLVVIAYGVQMLVVPVLLANPTGPAVVAGEAAVSGLGTSQVTITQASQRAVINWQQFNIAPNELTRFIQPNVNAVALNRIFDHNPSQIFGSLSANGTVILLNQNGIVFGPNAQVNVGGLIASSLNLTTENFMRGFYSFEGAGIEGLVKNMGAIHGAHEGVYLLAPNVENSGIITTAGGSIVLAAGAKAYLSNRPDGQGFLAEISAPVGHAVNLKDLIADGGNITMAGRVVNQEGLVQANSVRERNGKIELYASETLTLKSGSQTIAKGGSEGLSDGGTILAVADKLTGSATFEKGATLDVSGGTAGGHAGFVELSGSRVALGGRFVGTAQAGFRAGRLLIDPTQDLDLTGFTATDFSNITFETPRDAFGNFLPDWDLRVTGYFDLNALQPPPGGGTIRFEASRDLIFNDLLLWNNPFGAAARWDIVGVAERSILFTGFTGTTLQTAHGGGINLLARTGSVNLIDSATGALSTVHTNGSGGISITAGQDLVASTGFDESGGPLGLFNIQGLSIEGPGRLNLNVGGNFIGGLANGVRTGPGFVLRNPDTTVPLPQHTVNVAGRIGDTNLTLGANGLPLTAAELRAQGLASETESSARYADFALSNGDLSVTAGGNIYLSRIRDAGLVGGLDPATGVPREPAFAAGLEHNRASIVSNDGHILINTNPRDAGRQSTNIETLSSLLPASFEARADHGTIQIRSNLTFLPSPTGSVRIFARQDIQGVPKLLRADDPNFIWLYVGYGGLAGGQWVAVDQRTLPQRPDLWPFLANRPGSATLPPRPAQDQAPPSLFPESAKIDVDGNPPTVKLLEVDPAALAGNIDLAGVSALVSNNRPVAAENTSALAPVSFIAELGNISKLALNLVSRPFHKDITIQAGNRIEQFNAQMYLPDLGTQTHTVTERVPFFLDPVTNQPRPIRNADVILIRDPITNAVRPWDRTESVDPANLVNVLLRDAVVTVPTPRPAATIAAREIVLNRSSSADGGLQFFGPGTARVVARENLDLANGRGINLDRIQAGDQGGLLDIAVGNNLDMVTSGIFSRSGAGISIHGYDEARPYLLGYDNSALYPLQFPDSVRGGINLPAVGGRVNVGENSPRSSGGNNAPTGIQVVEGGSVGYMARTATANADGTVTVPIVRDPAAILIRARGDIDVNKSRIATFGGGDIRLTSLEGNINAGSGSKNERALFRVYVPDLDSAGNPRFNPDGTPVLLERVFEVPGSGIFTFHPQDPQPLVFPSFNDPEINALIAQANREGFLGRDVSALNERANQLRAERLPIFNETVLRPFIANSRLGDIVLTAERGSIIIPPAGIRGRTVTLNARVIDFQGGSVEGIVEFPRPPILPQPPVIGGVGPAGAAAPPVALGGGGTAGAASTTAAASATGVKQSDAVQESAVEASTQSRETKEAKKTDGKSIATQVAKSVRVKRGVVIQVDVKPQAQ
ncbi:filamentous hemagglutinin N-terminal domain-containing protein [Nitrospira sp. NS4]|uniref:two-partner secretion domain-containing protein n=1 Tax=Nitrospira sp. NS4 TaxID=3414498 RepID=UPI003C2B9725